MDITALNNTGTGANSSTAIKTAADTQDRFLKLLIAQMQNQDPMNPMDNAQVTSQMAQIQTVTGVGTLNQSIQALSSQFGQMQALQSVSLVGRDVTVPGNQLHMTGTAGEGAYELDSAADAVKLEVMTAAGTVLETVQLGAQGAGRQSFSWATDKYGPDSKLNFKITATKGTAVVPSQTFAHDKVVAINTSGSTLKLQLEKLGMVDYSNVISVD